MSEFDKKAAEWDADAKHVERSKAVAAAIKETIILSDEYEALEYGAGTGLLSFELKDYVKSITLMDSSQEMIRVLSEKIERSGVTNMKPLFFDLEKNSYDETKFDFVYSLMVMHHISDVKGIISKFFNLIKENGILAIVDLYKEDGSFHDSTFTGHKGFDPLELEETLRAFGFASVRHKKCYTINRTDESGQVREYPVFLMVAEKN